MAYFMPSGGGERSALVPMEMPLRDGAVLVVQYAKTEHLAVARDLLNSEIELGTSYPYEETLDEAGFAAYFLSHDAFVCTIEGDVAGIFYIKPNFPGRSGHIANGGFVTAPGFRRRGVGRAMGSAHLLIAASLGYRAVMFNLVYVSNEASLRLWRGLGFKEMATLKGAGRLKGLGFVDAIQMWKSLVDEEETP